MVLNYSKIADFCNEMKNINKSIRLQLGSIKDVFDGLNSSWQGEAANNYIRKSKNLSNIFDDFSDKLDSLIVYMIQCSDEYKKADEKVINDLNNIFNISKSVNIRKE